MFKRLLTFKLLLREHCVLF